MADIFLSQNIFIQYFLWYFYDIPKEILKGWKNFLVFNFNYFSIPLLFKTFFSHWRQYKWSYGRGFDPWRYLEAFFSNLISRILGAIMRTFLIVFGILTEILIAIVGAILFLGWILLPILMMAGIYFALKILFV
jgi:hypothetical protein